MKKTIAFLLILIALEASLYAQEIKSDPVKQFMQVTTVESIIGGGLGRSKMIITYPDGAQKESEMENLFSVAGINFKNIKENEDKILKTLKTYTDEGWKMEHVTSFALSPAENGQGIFMTRYLLSKPENKKAF